MKRTARPSLPMRKGSYHVVRKEIWIMWTRKFTRDLTCRWHWDKGVTPWRLRVSALRWSFFQGLVQTVDYLQRRNRPSAWSLVWLILTCFFTQHVPVNPSDDTNSKFVNKDAESTHILCIVWGDSRRSFRKRQLTLQRWNFRKNIGDHRHPEIEISGNFLSPRSDLMQPRTNCLNLDFWWFWRY